MEIEKKTNENAIGSFNIVVKSVVLHVLGFNVGLLSELVDLRGVG